MGYQQVLIFDLDDTLLDTSDLYWRARSTFARLVSEEGFEEQIIVDEFEKIDTENMEKLGFSPHRYGKSMVETYLLLCSRSSRHPQQKTIAFINDVCSQIVIDAIPETIEGAIELLEWAHEKFHLVLLTRGEEKLQYRKLQISNLIDYFREIYVVPFKDKQVLQSILETTGFEPENTWIIGDSIKSDINPGILIGAKCIFYAYKHHSYSWLQEYNVQPIGKFYKVKRIADVKLILESQNVFSKD